MEQVDLLFGKTVKSGKRAKPKKKEESLQLMVSKYLRSKYPEAIFNSDIASGMRLPIWIAAKAKAQRSERGQPDMIILEPRGIYFGLCLELKNEYSDVYLKDGTISNAKSNKHVLEQNEILNRLGDKGYYADFAFRENWQQIIDDYFAL